MLEYYLMIIILNLIKFFVLKLLLLVGYLNE